MIIVLFHVLYIFGKYIYDNINGRNERTEETAAKNQILNVNEDDYRDCIQPHHYDSKYVKIKFFPPVYVQRYNNVQNVIASGEYHGKIRKVVDFGCAELSFAIHLKNTEGVQEIICVDIDRAVLESSQSKVAPLHCDYLSVRKEPLKIHVCEGSIAHKDNKLVNTDAVTCIELIEHLYPDDLDAFPYTVFGFIKPQVAVVTTPNADFNVLFRDMKGFRHPDHKFEWTRQQFQDWASNITLRYPDYEVSFHGIGAGPPGTEHLGSCSQMAVFHRQTQHREEQIEGVDGLLKTVVLHDYPYRADNRSDEEKILDEAVYYIRLFSSRDEEFMEEIPLEKLMFTVEKFHVSIEILRSVLAEANWAIADREGGPVVLVPPQSIFSDHSDLDLDNFLEADYRRHSDGEWGELGPAAPGYLFDNYMERDTQNYEEEENWDEETNYDRRSSNSNPDNIVSAELQLTENFGHTSDSQWTMEDLNNEDPLLDILENQPSLALNNSVLETELPSNSFSIRLDRTDVDFLNTSSNTVDSSEQNLSSLLLLSDLSEALQSLGSADGHSLSENQSLSLPNDGLIESVQSEASNTDTCVLNREDSEFDGPVLNHSQNMKTNDQHDTKLEDCALQAGRNLSASQSGRSLVENASPSNETSNFSIEEATLLVSREQNSLKDDKKNISSENGQFLNECRKGFEEGVNSIGQKNNASVLTDYFLSKNDNYSDICSMYLQPSCISNNFFDTSNEIDLNITDSSATDEICTCLDVASGSRDSRHQKCETDLVNQEKTGSSDGMKSQDSMSFKSMSDCSLDLEPKYTSSPQISTDVCKIKTKTENGAERLPQKPNLDKRVSEPRNVPQCIQNLIVKGTSAGNTYQIKNKAEIINEFDRHVLHLELDSSSSNDNIPENKIFVKDEIALQKEKFAQDKKINEKDSFINLAESETAENVSPTTSELSLNSNVSSSTVTSTRSSNVDKWYVAETNPMYQRDIVVLKGGNDTADNPNEETPSESDSTDKGEDAKIIEVITRKGERARRDTTDVKSPDRETMICNSLTEEIDPELSSDFVQRENSIENYGRSQDIRMDHGSVIEKDLKCNIYEVTKTLTESKKKISEKIDETKCKSESASETTKKIIEIPPLAHSKIESDSTGAKIEFIPEHLTDLKKIGSSLPIDYRELPITDIFGTNNGERSQLKSALGINFKSISFNEVSTSCNLNKIGKERSNLKCELEPTRVLESTESKSFSPESLDGSPNSWSPEIMDSGYPNSASVHDITPEYELSSIANDRISDSDSASVGEPAVPAFYEFVEVENGDLANNNRDDEGNNVIAFEANDLDDLQPLIDVLENDMENENDIYVVQNGFPLWLLRILEMANPIDFEGIGIPQAQLYPVPLQQAGGDAPNLNAENDEGFDSSSSEEDSEIEDDEADDATTASSDETEDRSTENLRGDWRAGGDP